MTVRRLLVSGLGLLLASLLLLATVIAGASRGAPTQELSVRAWLSEAAMLVGAGLVVAAALISALRAPRPAEAPPRSIDHYS